MAVALFYIGNMGLFFVAAVILDYLLNMFIW